MCRSRTGPDRCAAFQRIETGQGILEGVEAAQAVRRGDVWRTAAAGGANVPQTAAARARAVAATFSWLATTLRTAA